VDEDHNTPVRIIKKKGKGHGGHHGGAWKVAYADFVTAMMSLFIVLWIVGQSDAVKQAVAAYFKDPGVFQMTKGGILPDGTKSNPLPPPPVPLDNIIKEMEKLKAEAGTIEKLIAQTPDFSKFKDEIQVQVTDEGLRIDLVEKSEGVFFDIGKATIKPATVQLLKAISSRLSEFDNHVVIEGYTDARPYVSSGYSNWNLSTDRANSARKVMEENGLRKNQISEVRGFADRKLKMPDKPLDYSNRRVSILMTPLEQAPQKATKPASAKATPANPGTTSPARAAKPSNGG
jgi:chemotaxis protein MotB